MPEPTALVSYADKTHNARAILIDLRTVGEDIWNRFTGRKDGTLWYYRSLVQAFEGVIQNPLTGELDRTVKEIENLTSNNV